jgi:multiple sugar transport system substrate-binding protein
MGAAFGIATLLAASALAGCSSQSGPPVLTWYINPDNGTQAKLAETCTQQANGQYSIRTALLPRESTGQREQLVRRLAAKDSGIDLMSLDVPYLAEFANADFARPFTDEERTELTEGMLEGPLEAAQWEDTLYAVPFNTNTQVLWYRKSVAERAGLDIGPDAQLTWEQVIQAAEQTKTTVQVQGKRYEGYMVWINSLIMSAGGQILENPEAGKDVRPAIDSDAGKRAAEVVRMLADSPAKAADLSNSDEGTTQAAFGAQNGGFMTNWPFIYAAASDDLRADIGWARWPAVTEGEESKPPLGGIDLAIGAFTKHPDLAVDAVKCITSPESQKTYMLGEGLLATVESVYDDPDVKKAFPMADLLRQSVDDAAPRPVTPYYPDITEAVQRTWHPESAVNDGTPKRAADLIVAVLHDEQLL